MVAAPTPIAAPAPLLPHELVSRLRIGDPTALTAAYQGHAGPLLLLARRLLGSSADAQDAVQDLFVALPEALRQYEERGQFAAWLRRLLVRIALMRLRTRRRRRETDLAPELRTPQRVDAGAESWDLNRALATLSPEQRTLVVLRAIEGYRHEEIAELLGIRRNTCEVRYSRALALLRAALETP